jgi:hypothetical protein
MIAKESKGFRFFFISVWNRNRNFFAGLFIINIDAAFIVNPNTIDFLVVRVIDQVPPTSIVRNGNDFKALHFGIYSIDAIGGGKPKSFFHICKNIGDTLSCERVLVVGLMLVEIELVCFLIEDR